VSYPVQCREHHFSFICRTLFDSLFGTAHHLWTFPMSLHRDTGIGITPPVVDPFTGLDSLLSGPVLPSSVARTARDAFADKKACAASFYLDLLSTSRPHGLTSPPSSGCLLRLDRVDPVVDNPEPKLPVSIASYQPITISLSTRNQRALLQRIVREDPCIETQLLSTNLMISFQRSM